MNAPMNTVIEIPTLVTPRLTLRAFRAGDLDPRATMLADMEVMHFLGGKTRSREETWFTMERDLGQWALRGYGFFAVEVEGGFAGHVGILHLPAWPEPELAWGLASSFWGRGLATEAAQVARDWAFSRFGWTRLVSYILPENIRSRRVAEKLGAAPQGTIVLRGVVADVWVHSKA